MTDTEISLRLATAIGWPSYLVDVVGVKPDYVIRCFVEKDYEYRTFDYRDPAVIWPIAERYKCFPDYCEDGSGNWYAWCNSTFDFVRAETPAKAVALAVIKAHEAKK